MPSPTRSPGRHVARLALVVLLGACVRTTANRFKDVPKSDPVPADLVVVYRNPAEVPRPYEQIAILDAEGSFTVVTETRLVNALRARAGSLGANGLLLAEVRSPSNSQKLGSVVIGGDAGARMGLRHGQAVAIRVAPDSAT